jgi:hypothetical protein
MTPRALVVLPFALLGLSVAAADATGLADELKEALLCKGNPLEPVQQAVKHGSFDAGVASATFGEGEGERTVIVLRTPITIAGAETRAVIKETTTSNARFKAIVYAEFSGKPKEAIKALKLEPSVAGGKSFVGAYERSLGKDIYGTKGSACPKTIGLTPLPKGGFLLGCGWCDG